MTVISPGDCTLQCGMWLWNHDNKFTKWQHPPRSRYVILHQPSKFIQIGPSLAEKNDVMSIFKMADLSHLGF